MEFRSESERDRLCIVHLVAGGAYGGLESVVAGLASGLLARGHACHVISVVDADGGDDNPFLAELRSRQVPTRTIRVPARAYRREQQALRSHLAELGADILHTHGYRADVQGALLPRSSGRRVVSTVHGFAGGDWKNRAYESLQRFALRFMDGVLAVSRPIEERLVRAGVDPLRIVPMPNAWEPPGALLARDEARSLLGIESGRPACGWVGRLSAEKAPDLFIRAIAACRRPDLLGVLVGDGGERARLEQLAVECGVERRIRFCGAVPRAYRVYSAFDAYCLSSRTEGTPIALLEAMNARVPIVATRVGGVPDVVSEEEARLVEPEQVEALAAAIDASIRDGGGARVEAAQGVARARYGTAQWIDRHATIYARLHAKEPAHSRS